MKLGSVRKLPGEMRPWFSFGASGNPHCFVAAIANDTMHGREACLEHRQSGYLHYATSALSKGTGMSDPQKWSCPR